MILIIEVAVGYMLKVLKTKQKLIEFKNEFDAIKHGDYKTFLNLVGCRIPLMVNYNGGEIRSEENDPNYECDFEGLVKSGPSLLTFYKNCFSIYGHIDDKDVPDLIYNKLVIFEIAIRMHANNNNILDKHKRENLVDVIKILSKYKNLSKQEEEKLQQARIFINMVKHYNIQFPSWEVGIKHFLDGFRVLKNNGLMIIN